MTTPGEFAQITLQCLANEIADGPFPIPPEKVCLRFGDRVNPTLGTGEDECCTGLAWVRVAESRPLFSAQLDDERVSNCLPTARLLTLELGTARCIPFGDVSKGPTCDAWTTAALKMDADLIAMEAAVCCATQAFKTLPFAPRSMPGQYTPLGPDGNCISGTLTLTIAYDCGCVTNGA